MLGNESVSVSSDWVCNNAIGDLTSTATALNSLAKNIFIQNYYNCNKTIICCYKA